MAETIPDLSDIQIEALLSAAEISLYNKIPATKSAVDVVAAEDRQDSLTVTAATPLNTPVETDIKAGKDAVKPVKHDELTLRVPQLYNKNKKVCQLPPSPT